MRVLLDVKDSKALFFMELLNNFSFVNVPPIPEKKANLLQEMKKTDAASEENTSTNKQNTEKDIFAEVRGIWADRDIDGRTLRNQAWGIER